MTTYSDPAAAYIAKVREDNRTPGEEAADRIREQHVPALLAAVEVVLALHKPTNHGDCWSCLAAYGEREEWPCEEYRAISAALLLEPRPRLRETESGDG